MLIQTESRKKTRGQKIRRLKSKIAKRKKELAQKNELARLEDQWAKLKSK